MEKVHHHHHHRKHHHKHHAHQKHEIHGMEHHSEHHKEVYHERYLTNKMPFDLDSKMPSNPCMEAVHKDARSTMGGKK